MASISAPSRTKTRLPALFGRETHLLGWQGMTVTLPAEWNLASFGGTEVAGNLRVDDAEGPRLELRWEQPKGTPLLDRSIESFVDRMAREAKKKSAPFTILDDVHIVSPSRKRKAQLVNFGWLGEQGTPDDMIVAGQGYGLGWHCTECGRVVVAHLIGRGHENPEAVRKVAHDVLVSMECHGSGGWQTWSVFDLELEVPEEFHLANAKMLTGRIEIEWTRPPAPGLFAWTQRVERLRIVRVAPANVLLENEELSQWVERTVAGSDKKLSFGLVDETMVRDHPALLWQGVERHLRRRAVFWMLDRVLRRRTPPAQLRAWHCEPSNKIYLLTSALSVANAHVTGDVLDSLECH